MAERKYEILQSMMGVSVLISAIRKMEQHLTREEQDAILKIAEDGVDLGIGALIEEIGMDEEEIKLRGEAAAGHVQKTLLGMLMKRDEEEAH